MTRSDVIESHIAAEHRAFHLLLMSHGRTCQMSAPPMECWHRARIHRITYSAVIQGRRTLSSIQVPGVRRK